MEILLLDLTLLRFLFYFMLLLLLHVCASVPRPVVLCTVLHTILHKAVALDIDTAGGLRF